MIDPKNPDFSNTPVSPNRPRFKYQPVDPLAEPAVSIVTPFFNTGAVFLETVQSVMQQSLQQWEWIIVNDGSYDPEALQILKSLRQSDPRIRIVDHMENRGLPAARNTGTREARSKYILYLDSDDLLEPTAAEKWRWFLESYPKYSFAGGYSTGFGTREYLWHSGFQNMERNLEENQINHVVMVRKDVWQNVGGYDETMREGLEDWDYWIRCAAKGYWGGAIPEYLHWYRTRSNHMDRWKGLDPNRLREKRDEFKHRYPNLWKGAFPKFSSFVHLDIPYPLNEDIPFQNRLLKEKPRLLLIAPWLVTGGAEKFNLDLINQLSKRGWQVTVASTRISENPWQHEFEKLTPDVFPLANFLEWSDYPRFLVYLIQSRQVDAIFLSASQEAYRLLPYIKWRFPKIPILDYIHFVTPDWMDGGFPRLSLLFESSIDQSIVTSQQVKNWMVSEEADPHHIEVCYANVDTNFWQPDPDKRIEFRSKLGLTVNIPLILYIGRLEQQKQPKVFAETMFQLHQKKLNFRCLVIGDGSMREWLESFIRRKHLESKVQLLGSIPLEQVRDYMTAGDIIFLPSENEGISLTFYEGMAMGLVPVGADVGGQKELVTPDCGILLQRGTEAEEALRYCEALTTLIVDPEKIRKMGQASIGRINSNFTLDLMGQKMESLLQRAISQVTTRPHEIDPNELAALLGRQVSEYLRASREVERLHSYIDSVGSMPPASARTYLYFALRQTLFPILGKVEEGWLGKVKNWVKSRLVKTP